MHTRWFANALYKRGKAEEGSILLFKSKKKTISYQNPTEFFFQTTAKIVVV